MSSLLSSLWYVYVAIIFFMSVPEAITSIEDSFILLFVTSFLLVIPEVFNNE